MITESFTIKKSRLVELQAFIKKEMPTFRFCGNPTQLHDVILIRGRQRQTLQTPKQMVF